MSGQVFFLMLTALCTWLTALGGIALYRLLFVRKRPGRVARENLPAVSVLKPLKGVDSLLESNLVCLFQQDYPSFELLFGLEDEADPAVPIVRKLMDRYPRVQSRLVIHQGGRGFNPKVSNLRAILDTGSHDILVINDSNIAVSPDYLVRMVSHLLQENVGLVTSPIAGTGEENLPALLENMQLNGPNLNSLALHEVLMREVLVVGKSLMFRRSVFEPLGGFESVAYVQAEDYYMGKMIIRAGYEVVSCSQPVHNTNTRNTFAGLWGRHLRWAVARSHVAPHLYPWELLLKPFLIALLAHPCGVSPYWAFAWMIALTISRDSCQWYLLRGSQNLPWVILLSPFLEVFLCLIWICAPFCSVISWRGHQFQVGEGARLFRKPPGSESQPAGLGQGPKS